MRTSTLECLQLRIFRMYTSVTQGVRNASVHPEVSTSFPLCVVCCDQDESVTRTSSLSFCILECVRVVNARSTLEFLRLCLVRRPLGVCNANVHPG